MTDTPTTAQCRLPSRFVDSDHPDVVSRARSLITPGRSAQENAVTLFYWVRDAIRYNPYGLSPAPEAFLASSTLKAGDAWCVPKAILLAALCRAVGIPARLGFADVRNHLSTQRLRETMQTDVFYFHGYTSILLDERWVKATPAFNKELCDKFGLLPLEFDGLHDSLYHAFDATGNRHMEYVRDRGEHLDLPLEEMITLFRARYPAVFANSGTALPEAANWQADVDREAGLS
jgi:transglutaminase-like putative cysteine protease